MRTKSKCNIGVPRVWEKIEESIKTAGRNNKGIKKAVGDWAKVL